MQLVRSNSQRYRPHTVGAFSPVPAGSVQLEGQVLEVCGTMLKVSLWGGRVGDFAQIDRGVLQPLRAQIIGFSGTSFTLSPFGDVYGIQPGARVTSTREAPSIPISSRLLGRVVDGLGRPIGNDREQQNSSLVTAQRYSLWSEPPAALDRQAVETPFITGLASIDTFTPLAYGQRIAVLAEPGVGKTSLLAQISSAAECDVSVLALVGERNREVKEAVDSLQQQGSLSKSVVVASTASEPAAMRCLAVYTATRIAEYFRDAGLRVVLQVDSLTRLVRALREVGLGAGEIPVRRGYPPSVFARLPQLLERAGTGSTGSITGFYSVLLSSDLDEDPMVEEIKGLTDGHIILSRKQAERGIYPAIDIERSLSRLASTVQSTTERRKAQDFRIAVSRLEEEKDAMLLGARSAEQMQLLQDFEYEVQGFLRQPLGVQISLEQQARALDQVLQSARAAQLLSAAI